MPKLDTAQRRGLPVHAPERAHVPSQTLAHSPQYSRSGLFDRDRFRQDQRDHVLYAEAFFCALALGQVEHESCTLISALLEGRHADQHGNAAAVFPEALLLKRLQTPVLQMLLDQSRIAIAPLRWREVGPAYAARDEILMVEPHDVEKGFIRLQNPAVEIPHEDADDVGVERATVA